MDLTAFTQFIDPGVVSWVAGVIIGGGVVMLLVVGLWKRLSAQASVISQPGAATVGVPAQQSHRRRMTGLTWMIAFTHRSVSQIVGLEMSMAILAAVLLSVLCAVAGVAMIAYQQFHTPWIALVGGGATFVLAMIIETISINALKSIRIANEALKEVE